MRAADCIAAKNGLRDRTAVCWWLWAWVARSVPLVMSVMLVAPVTVHMGQGFFASTNGVELPFLYIGGAVALAFSGAGQYSLDHLLGLDAVFPQMAALIALVLGALAALGNLAVRDVTKTAIKRS